MAFSVSRERFEELAERALETLPEQYREYFTNITIIVEDYPDSEDTKQLGTKRSFLLGLFSGVPYPDKGGFFNIPYPLPDKITLFQKNIESICSSEKELIGQIQATLVHEVGHYFGLSERDLRELED
ncbi:MAG TPA: metallopeptidase family protein [Thermodesulfovibrionales bacterium]|nr:metallopeptidase family protein [Thermodesulfovibrionales bacterium]